MYSVLVEVMGCNTSRLVTSSYSLEIKLKSNMLQIIIDSLVYFVKLLIGINLLSNCGTLRLSMPICFSKEFTALVLRTGYLLYTGHNLFVCDSPICNLDPNLGT